MPFHEKADVYIINTCSVTNMADKKSRQMISRARKTNPEAVVAAAGCYVQAAGDQLLEERRWIWSSATTERRTLSAVLDEFFISKGHQSYIVDLMHTKEYEEMKMARSAEHTRAIYQGAGRMQPVLQLLHYSVYPWPRQKPSSGGCTGGNRRAVQCRVSGICSDRYPSELLWRGFF